MKPTEGTAARAWPLYLTLLVLLATVASHLSLLQYAAGCRGAYPLSSSSSSSSIAPDAAEEASVRYTLTSRGVSHHSSSNSSTGAAAQHSTGGSVQSHKVDGLHAAQPDASAGNSATGPGEGLDPGAAGSAAASSGVGLAHGAQGALSVAADSQPEASAIIALKGVTTAAAAATAAGTPGELIAQAPLPRIFVGVLSESRNFAARQAIRQTWGSDPRLTRVVFFILRPRTQRGMHLLRQEASEFGDVIVTSEVLESYYNCTYSVLTMLKAAAAMGPSVDFLVKTDDDAYVRVTSLLEAIRDLPRQRLYSGYGMRAIPTPRSGTWAISYDTWPHEMTAPYSYGLGYVLSMDLVRQMAAGAFHAAMDADNLIRIEDVAIGVAVEAIAAWDGTEVKYDTSMQYDLKGCEEGAVFVQMPKVRQGWRVHADMMRCIHSRDGRCCAAPEEQQEQQLR